MKNNVYDFSGYATKNDIVCSDGRVIKHNAFLDNDGMKVPLVWNHQHNTPDNVLGHAYLENREDGVYAYGVFNQTDTAQNAKELVRSGDITSLSIFANQLQQNGNEVVHGNIREVSVVLAGANPGATIDYVAHSFGSDNPSAIITVADSDQQLNLTGGQMKDTKTFAHADDAGGEEGFDAEKVFASMTEEQQSLVYGIVAALEEEAETVDDAEEDADKDEETKKTDKKKDESDDTKTNTDDSKEEGKQMKHNVFEGSDTTANQAKTLSHSDEVNIINAAKKSNYNGSLRDAFQATVEETGAAYDNQKSMAHGITNMGVLFPDAKPVNGGYPYTIQRDNGWVQDVMQKVHKTPFAKIKSTYFDITADEARARGYVKGEKKIESVITAAKRETTPTTVYRLHKLDRDDVVDITDFSVVEYLKAKMRLLLEEEVARAVLIGDGRTELSNDKIRENNIRPIWTDDDLYTIKMEVDAGPDATPAQQAEQFIDDAVRARLDYKGTGRPTLYTTEAVLTEMLLLKDKNGRRIYKTEEELATAMRVVKIVTVTPMEQAVRGEGEEQVRLLGLIVNMNDYNVGNNKGGEVNLFDDFDLNFNKLEYLIETRLSGALVNPHSAIALETKVIDVAG